MPGANRIRFICDSVVLIRPVIFSRTIRSDGNSAASDPASERERHQSVIKAWRKKRPTQEGGPSCSHLHHSQPRLGRRRVISVCRACVPCVARLLTCVTPHDKRSLKNGRNKPCVYVDALHAAAHAAESMSVQRSDRLRNADITYLSTEVLATLIPCFNSRPELRL